MNIVVYTRTSQYERVHTGMYTFCRSLISLFDTGFRGSHRDDAMQAPAPAHTSCMDGDPRPCAEDENFFESRPDAEDMEEAISKFMEGMEREECTGYNALHKLLQTLYPAQGTRGCLMGEFRQHVMSSTWGVL